MYAEIKFKVIYNLRQMEYARWKRKKENQASLFLWIWLMDLTKKPLLKIVANKQINSFF